MNNVTIELLNETRESLIERHAEHCTVQAQWLTILDLAIVALTPKYRMLEVGEPLTVGDEYNSSDSGWREIPANIAGNVITVGGGLAFGVGSYRRPCGALKELQGKLHAAENHIADLEGRLHAYQKHAALQDVPQPCVGSGPCTPTKRSRTFHTPSGNICGQEKAVDNIKGV